MREQNLSVLTIGNSFTWSLSHYFDAVVRSAGCSLTLDFANFGGCELQRHWSYIKAEEADPDCRIYGGGGKKLRDLLSNGNWDVVTIQQASHMSWKPETYQPYASLIQEYVERYAPQSELVIQQTWAYRLDHAQFRPGSEWGITQDQMYEKLTHAYKILARDLDLRVIPTGWAVQLARETQPVKFNGCDPAVLNALTYPDLPSQAGALVGNMQWVKDEKTREMRLVSDLIHLNGRGDYLQACVWFAFLYGRSTDEITLDPDCTGAGDAAFLRKIAQKAVDSFPQVK